MDKRVAITGAGLDGGSISRADHDVLEISRLLANVPGATAPEKVQRLLIWHELTRVAYKELAERREPTAQGDAVATDVRAWYEVNRETWWERHRPGSDKSGVHADEFMLSLIAQVHKVEKRHG